MQQHKRTFCQQCGTWRFKPEGQLCFHCQQGSTVETEQEAAPAVSEPIVFGGHEITAPGFDAHSFERAIVRALADDIEIVTTVTGETIAQHRGCNGSYRVSRHACQCAAGVHGRPCKHRAMFCFVQDVRAPHVARQWAQARKVAA
jgi:hypothetical protein